MSPWVHFGATGLYTTGAGLGATGFFVAKAAEEAIKAEKMMAANFIFDDEVGRKDAVLL
jgi:hypothetical protein